MKINNFLLYGKHAVMAALANPNRQKSTLYISENALQRLDSQLLAASKVQVKICDSKILAKMVATDAVHQNIILRCQPLDFLPDSQIDMFLGEKLLVALDQISDPHNVGAIMRSAEALGVKCLILPHRGSAMQSSVMAKSASGALDMLQIVETRHFAKCLLKMKKMGFEIIGLDGSAEFSMPEVLAKVSSGAPKVRGGAPTVLVLGNEGKGLRENTREACSHLAKLEMAGQIKSLNVSNAATLAIAMAMAMGNFT